MYFGAQAVAAAARASANARAVTEEMRVIMASACDPIWRHYRRVHTTCVRASSSVEAPMSLSFVSAAPEGPGPRHEASRGGALSGVTARGHFLSPRTYLIITESN